MKYLLPYEQQVEEDFVRKLLGKRYENPRHCEARIRKSWAGKFVFVCEGYPGGGEKFETMEETMVALDEVLKNKGYTLLTKEQAEKLLVLI